MDTRTLMEHNETITPIVKSVHVLLLKHTDPVCQVSALLVDIATALQHLHIHDLLVGFRTGTSAKRNITTYTFHT